MTIGQRTKRETGMPRRTMAEGEQPKHRVFDGMKFRLEGYFPSTREANYHLSEFKENYYTRKVKFPGMRGYLIYVREKRRK